MRFLRFEFAALAASVLLLLAAVAQAQTTPTSTSTTPQAQASTEAAGTMAVSDVIAVPVWPKAALPLPEQPVATSFNLGQIEGVPPKLVTGVTANGYARKVAVEDQTVGQVLVVSVAKGDRTETISTEGLTAQFDAAETSQLFPEKTVEVKGSKTALIAALERLNQTPEKEKEEKKETDQVTDNATSTGGKSSNSEAASYRTPTTTSPTTTDDPVIDVRTTTDGCKVRIDYTQEKAFVQSKEQTFSDGSLSSEGTCSDSEVSYPLKKSYLACPVDITDVETMQAWPQFQWFYVDDAGESHSIGDCGKDEATVYTITEDEGQCPVYLDFLAEKAVPQSAMVYIGRNNALTQVPGKGCAASTLTAAVPLVENKSACSMRPDYVNNLSYELSMWTYILKGVTYQAAPCADTGRTFQHDLVYTDSAGANICPTISNLTATPKTVTLQYRRRITVDGVPQFITDCTPDTTSKAVLATTNGCLDPSKWTHDLDAGFSYGQERFYYVRADGTPEYVTLCQDSTVTYTHDVTITGYQYHDEQLWAYALSTVTITVSGKPYSVATSTVLPGTAQWSYVLQGVEDQPTGETSSESGSCNSYKLTAKYEHYKRPDDTDYLKKIGTGTPIGPVDVCITTIVKSQQYQTGYGWSEPSCSGGSSNPDDVVQTVCSWTNYTYYQTVNRTERKNPETGEVVATTCGWPDGATWKGTTSYSSETCTGFCSGVPWKASDGVYIGSGEKQKLSVPPCPSGF